MKYLEGEEYEKAVKYLNIAKEVAQNSTCFRSRCGSIIVSHDEIIGEGFNSAPLCEKLDHCFKDELSSTFKSDKTCCIHAEQRAIMEALKNNGDKINASRLYFIRTDEKGDLLYAGKPYCTICSKMSLDAGISEFVLWHDNGICVYETDEYNKLSFQYKE